MIKPGSLRETLVAAIAPRHPAYRTDAALMHMVALDVGFGATGRPGTAFEYRYTLAISVFDFPGQPEEISVPLMLWVQRWQHDLITDPTRSRDLSIDVEFLESKKVDVIVRLRLTEVVRFVPTQSGGHEVTFVPEPLPMFLADGAPLHRVYLDGELIASCAHDVP